LHPVPDTLGGVVDTLDRGQDFGQAGFIGRAPAKILADGGDQHLLVFEEAGLERLEGLDAAVGAGHRQLAKGLALLREQLLHAGNRQLLALHIGNIGYHGASYEKARKRPCFLFRLPGLVSELPRPGKIRNDIGASPPYVHDPATRYGSGARPGTAWAAGCPEDGRFRNLDQRKPAHPRNQKVAGPGREADPVPD
ncbi:MAG: hypothetical protein V2J65_12045, partial [Desulfobacteraceae bacterium]|nr:hypothetical protein [Desulfobacteraceae bacterium]